MKKVFYEKKRKYFLLAYCSSLIIHQIFAARGNSQFICQALMWITDEIMSVCCISLQYEREYWTVNCPMCAFIMHKTRKKHKHRSCGCTLRSVLSIVFILSALRENLFKNCLYIYVSLLEERGNGKNQLISSCTNQPKGKCHKITESLLGNVVKLGVIPPLYYLTDFFRC